MSLELSITLPLLSMGMTGLTIEGGVSEEFSSSFFLGFVAADKSTSSAKGTASHDGLV